MHPFPHFAAHTCSSSVLSMIFTVLDLPPLAQSIVDCLPMEVRLTLGVVDFSVRFFDQFQNYLTFGHSKVAFRAC